MKRKEERMEGRRKQEKKKDEGRNTREGIMNEDG